MFASRFDADDFEDKQTAAIGSKLLAAADGLKISIHRDSEGKVLMTYQLEGSFGTADEEGDFPRCEAGDAKTTSGELMRGFFG